LCFKVHPYRWSTIGKDISHIEGASLQDVVNFYTTFYNPSNAILSVSGNIDEDILLKLLEKWFGDIRKPHSYIRNIPKEPQQTERRELDVERDVPQDCLVISFPMCERKNDDYYKWDLLTDILSGGQSSRLHQSLVKEKQLFSGIDASITGSIDAGQCVFRGDILPDVSFQQAEDSIWGEISKLKYEPIPDMEMTKILNQAETSNAFRNVGILSKAMNLAYYELLGDADLLNQEIREYRKVTKEDIRKLASDHLIAERSSVLRYASMKSKIK